MVLIDALQDGCQVEVQESIEVEVAFSCRGCTLGILYDTVDVQGDNVARTGHHTCQARSGVESILRQLILQTAARSE